MALNMNRPSPDVQVERIAVLRLKPELAALASVKPNGRRTSQSMMKPVVTRLSPNGRGVNLILRHVPAFISFQSGVEEVSDREVGSGGGIGRWDREVGSGGGIGEIMVGDRARFAV
ncbi:MAG: hypothetical protein ABGY24_04590, partial [bacterium]